VEIPEPVPPSVSASSASAHSFAVKSDGTGWGWGFEVGKRLIAPNFVADYDRPRKTKPVVADFKQIVPGFGISLALDINGDVWSWGSESSGELGNGSFNTQNVDPPVKVSGISNIIQVATGGNNSMALDKDGFVWAWGENSRGQLGDKTTTDRATPSKVFDKDGNPLVNIVAISLGAFGGVNVFTHSLALDKNGFVWAWGDNNYGQLGNNQSPLWGNVDYVNYAVKVKDNTGAGSLSNIASISAGAGDSFAVEKTTGKVWSWGSDGNAGHGAGAACNGGGNPCFRLPGKVFDTTGSGEISNIKEISAGADHVLALDNSGKVLAWGKNSKGQLGQNNTNDSGFPIKVLDTSGSGELSDIGSITAGHSHSIVMKNDGITLLSWGNNADGQLGIGNTNSPKTLPVLVPAF
jgi:alpha-tubulin suppressor-like RCC1 family protein